MSDDTHEDLDLDGVDETEHNADQEEADHATGQADEADDI